MSIILSVGPLSVKTGRACRKLACERTLEIGVPFGRNALWPAQRNFRQSRAAFLRLAVFGDRSSTDFPEGRKLARERFQAWRDDSDSRVSAWKVSVTVSSEPSPRSGRKELSAIERCPSVALWGRDSQRGSILLALGRVSF